MLGCYAALQAWKVPIVTTLCGLCLAAAAAIAGLMIVAARRGA